MAQPHRGTIRLENNRWVSVARWPRV